MALLDDITTYYKQHFDALAFDKQFHFASRLAAWSQDEFCTDILATSRSLITAQGDLTGIKEDLRTFLTSPPRAKINAAATRQQYFDKYPDLRGRMLALFRVRHLLTIYKIDARRILLELCPLEDFLALSNDLQKDSEAIKVLSTYAVNYIYLLHTVLYSDKAPNSHIATLAYSLGTTYNTSQPEQIQLLIYLYTHCIIGETNFYNRPILQQDEIYSKMLIHLEKLVETSFENINLDNKLEFLVCCRIMGYDTTLFARIYAECNESISSEGTFLIDTINSYKQSSKTSFNDSEHRNVLFIMSQGPYPHAAA